MAKKPPVSKRPLFKHNNYRDPDDVAREINEEYYAEQRRLKREEKKRKLKKKQEPAPDPAAAKTPEQDAAFLKKVGAVPESATIQDVAEVVKQINSDLNTALSIVKNRLLFDAVRLNDVAQAKELLDAGADVNARDDYNNTPLIIASAYSDYDLVELLLKYHADVTLKSASGFTALYLSNGPASSPSITKLLKQHGATI
jgi:ankyrin repeat protein